MRTGCNLNRGRRLFRHELHRKKPLRYFVLVTVRFPFASYHPGFKPIVSPLRSGEGILANTTGRVRNWQHINMAVVMVVIDMICSRRPLFYSSSNTHTQRSCGKPPPNMLLSSHPSPSVGQVLETALVFTEKPVATALHHRATITVLQLLHCQRHAVFYRQITNGNR